MQTTMRAATVRLLQHLLQGESMPCFHARPLDVQQVLAVSDQELQQGAR